MRISVVRRIGVLVFVAALTTPAVAQSARAARVVLAAPRRAVRVAKPLPPEVFAAALRAGGTVIRREDGLTVERVRVPSDLLAANPTVPSTVFRVTLAGRFPPRALRYVVLAGGRPIG